MSKKFLKPSFVLTEQNKNEIAAIHFSNLLRKSSYGASYFLLNGSKRKIRIHLARCRHLLTVAGLHNAVTYAIRCGGRNYVVNHDADLNANKLCVSNTSQFEYNYMNALSGHFVQSLEGEV
jgi:hypothetical protein